MAVGTHGYKYDFFLSYAEDGRGWACGELLPKLLRSGMNILLEEHFDDGQPILQAREEAVQNSWRTLIVLTPGYFADSDREIIELLGFTRRLVSADKEYPVIPIIFKEIDRSLLLHVVGAVDLTADDEDIRNREFSRLLKKQGIEDSLANKKPDSPYPGMSPFRQEDAHVFFGREEEINQCADYIRDNHLLVLTGVSGCGKSSLVNAGIIPQLTKHKNAEKWLIKYIRPSMILNADSENHQAMTFDTLFPDFAEGKKPLLFVDQFEEIFVSGQINGLTDTSRLFLQELALIAKRANLILTVRDEFYSQLAWCREWLDVDPHLRRVDFIGRQGLVDAIRKPAGKQKVYLDHVLVERIVNDAGDDPGILPFVQETMCRLWERMNERYIDIKAYEKLQGFGVSGLKYAIAAKADSAYKSLPSDEHRDIARRIFIRLVQFGEGKPDTRRQLSVSRLQVDSDSPELFEKTLEHLSSENHRLLILSGGNGDEQKVDIVHESLILAWPQLQSWLGEFCEYDKQHRTLEFKTDEWIRLGSGESGLLDKGEVSEVRTLLGSSYSRLLGIDSRIRNFIKNSEMSLDPGWNQVGLISLLIMLFSGSMILGFFYLMSSAISSDVVRNTIYITIVLAVMFLIGFFWWLGGRRNYIYKSKQYSHVFSGMYHVSFAFLTLFLCVFLWGRFGLEERDRQLFCSNNRISPNNENVIDIAILTDKENQAMSSVLRQALGVSGAIKASELSKGVLLESKCKSSFDYIAEVVVNDNSGNVSYGVNVWSVKSNERILIEPKLSSLNTAIDACEKMFAVGYDFLKAIKMDGFLKRLDSNVSGQQASCSAYQANFSAAEMYRNRRYHDAVNYAMSALHVDEKFLPSKNTLGYAYIKLGEYDKAISVFSEAIFIARVPRFYEGMGIALTKKERFSDAEVAFKEAIGIGTKDDDVDAYYGLSLLYFDWFKRDKSKSKENEFLSTIELFRSKLLWNVELDEDTAINLRNKGNYYKAIANFYLLKGYYQSALDYLGRADSFTRSLYEEIVFLQAIANVKMNDTNAACKKWKEYNDKVILKNHFIDDIEEGMRESTVKDYLKHCY